LLCALAVIVVVAVLGLIRWRASVLLKTSNDQRSGAFNLEINAALYGYAANPGFRGNVLTNCQVLGFLPGLGPLYRFHPLSDENNLDTELARPTTTHVLYYAFDGLPDSLKRRVDSGRLVQVASGNGFYIFQIRAPNSTSGADSGR
jgi:hypothetical protein